VLHPPKRSEKAGPNFTYPFYCIFRWNRLFPSLSRNLKKMKTRFNLFGQSRVLFGTGLSDPHCTGLVIRVNPFREIQQSTKQKRCAEKDI
jgi:hypothetical protein